jgi:hypothetical protein
MPDVNDEDYDPRTIPNRDDFHLYLESRLRDLEKFHLDNMKWRTDVEKWQIRTDILVNEIHTQQLANQHETNGHFSEIIKQMKVLTKDQETWATIRQVFQWLVGFVGVLVAGAWAVWVFLYEHLFSPKAMH